MKHVIVSCDLPEAQLSKLSKRGFQPISMPRYDRLGRGVSAHPDMLLFFLGNICITTSEYYGIARESFCKIEALGYTVRLTDEVPDSDYPKDILFNSLLLGNTVYGNEKGMSRELISLARERNIDIVNVRQGYTKCSVLKVSENAIVTADKSIANAASARGTDVLLIRPGYIRLEGYDTGFIGGCAGNTNDTVYFCGDILSHPDGTRIVDFCKKHKKECVSLENNILFDAGSLFFI